MIIINATKTVKTILTARGDVMTIQPGGQSEMTVASSYLVRAAMKLGDPSEIGIVINGSYEMQVASQITGSAPYLYTDLQEALSKLIDPSIDYTAKLDNSKNVLQLQDELAGKNKRIKDLESEIGELNSRLTLAEAADLKADLEKQVRTLETENKNVTSDKLRLEKQLSESQDQVTKQNDALNQLRQQVGEKDQILSQLNAQIKDLTAKLESATVSGSAELEAKLSEANAKVTELEELVATANKQANDLQEANGEYETQIRKLQESKDAAMANLKEASQTIENMKTSFNAACEKFGLYLDDDGEWQQELPSKSSE